MKGQDNWRGPRLAVFLLVGMLVAIPALLFSGHATAEAFLVASVLGAAVTANQLLRRRDCNKNGGPVAASTTLYQGTMAFVNATGYIDDDTASGVNKFAGIVPVQVDNSSGAAGDLDTDLFAEGQFLLTGSGFTQADVGKPVFATDNNTIVLAPTDAAVYVGTVATFESTTTLWVRLDTEEQRIAVLSEAFVIGDFTDNADTTGYVDMAAALPVGAIPLAWKAVTTTGFTGDTTAAIQVGVSGDVDRFSGATDQSVLAAGTVGASALGVADSLDGIGAASTPRITVTGTADFGSIAAGAMTVTVYYLRP